MNINAAIFDLDGTVYLGDELIDGAESTIQRLREQDIPVLFLTNKAIEQREDYSKKLTKLGIPTTPEQVISSGWVSAQYIADHFPDCNVFVVGEDPLKSELRTAGVTVVQDLSADVVLASMDRHFTYEKLHLAAQMVEGGAVFLATNPDRTCPTPNGNIPDAAGMVGAIEGVTGRSVDAILGKPSETMVKIASEKLGAESSSCLIVGDRLDTDIEMGMRAGMTTALVLTGVTSESDLVEAEITPDHIFESIKELGECFE